MSKQQLCRDDPGFYHFAIHDCRNAGFTVGDHDYKPKLGKINVPLAQDLPRRVVAPYPGGALDRTIDPYLPIAKLRKKFEGNGRKLGGYILLLSGVRLSGTKNDQRRCSLDQIPSWKYLHMDIASNGMWGDLKEVHPFGLFHLNHMMAYPMRRMCFHDSIRMFQRAIQNAKTEKDRQNQLRWQKEFTGLYGMTIDQGNAQDLYDFMDGAPKLPQQLQIMQPPYVVKMPNEPLEWVQLEAAIKRHMERMYNNGYVAINCVHVLATDMDGAITVGCSMDRFVPVEWAEFANQAYWITFQRSIVECILHWLPNTPEGWESFREFVYDRYDLLLDEYLSRPLGPWKDSFSDWELRWMADMRQNLIDLYGEDSLPSEGPIVKAVPLKQQAKAKSKKKKSTRQSSAQANKKAKPHKKKQSNKPKKKQSTQQKQNPPKAQKKKKKTAKPQAGKATPKQQQPAEPKTKKSFWRSLIGW